MDTHGHEVQEARESRKWSFIGLAAALAWLAVVAVVAYSLVPAAH